jgi:hypothetical protein
MYSICLLSCFDDFPRDSAIGAKPSDQPQSAEMFKTFVTHCHSANSNPAPAPLTVARSTLTGLFTQDTLRMIEQELAIINLYTAQVEE